MKQRGDRQHREGSDREREREKRKEKRKRKMEVVCLGAVRRVM